MKNLILTAGLVLGATMATGCASMGGMARAPKCYAYPMQNFQICEASPTFVNAKCDQGELSDSGYMITNPKKFYGCADRANGVAWIAWDAPQPETTIHEICHMLGEKTADCEKIRAEKSDLASQQLSQLTAARF